MQDNHYAPPKAAVEGAFVEGATAPALWNPNAAASWSLLFSAIFGTWLHWRNWEALGETARASTARMWFYAAVALIGVSVLILSGSGGARGGVRLVNIVFLLTWYFTAAKAQVQYVKERFGENYPRRGWIAPIVTAIGVIIATIVVITVLVLVGRV